MNLFSAESGLKASVVVFLLSCTFITTSYTTTFAFDHPLESAILACFLAAILLLITSRFADSFPTISSPAHKYSAIPLTELSHSAAEEPSSPSNHNGNFPSRKPLGPSRWIGVGLLSGMGCLRIALYHQLNHNDECAPTGYAYMIPFLIALYDYWRNQRGRPNPEWIAPEGPSNAHLRMFVTVASRAYFYLCRSRLRNVFSAVFLMTAGLLVATFDDGRQSTYICPSISGLHPRFRAYRFLSVALDTLILIGAAELCREGNRSRDGRKKQALVSWGCGFLGVAVICFIAALVLKKVTPGDGGFVNSHYLRSAAGQGLLVTFTVLSAFQLMPFYGAVGISILAASVSIDFMLASILFNGQSFPLILPSRAFAALLLTFLGVMLYLCGQTASEEEPQFLYVFNVFMRIFFSIIFGFVVILIAQQPSVTNVHPIDLLIYEGRKNHDRWKSSANGSKNLAEVVAQYRAKYNQHPPPGFDKWYEYATSRSSVVIDEFDQIYDNLLPFRALPPEEIRKVTHQLATNPYNDIGAISIRNGTARVQQGIKPTHAWMVIGAAKIIEKFSEHLPDMDLAFNLNDEPRVSVPWEKMSVLRAQARSQTPPASEGLTNGWSSNRDEGWAPIEPADQTTETMFTDSSFVNIFDRYVGALCPHSSKARSQRMWDRHHICMGCIRPHSMGQFPSDWTVATDICHQPDLASFHGFFVSPASFKVTQDLVPVFSQSTISGFGDIIFPSPWNYVDKIKYEPSEQHPDLDYVEKENRLFWIGGTSEGVSRDGQWQGMPRQRLAHLVNNNTYNKVSVLLPTGNADTYSYQILDGLAPTEKLGLNASVHVTDPIVRCRKDCEDQKQELGTVGRVDFQSHWNYRFLFDADGAGFSGRFLPFLQSHSLPFKTGLFRQWFDSRITAWLHFVPVDVRLHGLWSTLAYFGGVNIPVGVDDKGHPKAMIEPHDLQGRWIAEEGRKWAERVLRKEDMEIYFFRLLLEWGRLTDDQRDILGYTE
ncbi:capsular associated protein [Aspergillus nomiae NRRL 13137]|uniref:Capsular associated protein n=1 Tax=Aspergillus nomiae NRRL (strain ATCC 15546 / NRRL 13137 / CBS 260.88 / M93) TaxID=1509407 RepID=A0A0L1IP87_ASPN3|nr:capsular associated protein [Aspergillus nomiae NRRL 13137]KNG81319.1 capsular associated protein [Aspergillus nomiae NRRL 13137]